MSYIPRGSFFHIPRFPEDTSSGSELVSWGVESNDLSIFTLRDGNFVSTPLDRRGLASDYIALITIAPFVAYAGLGDRDIQSL